MTFEYVWINLYPHINPTNPVNQHRHIRRPRQTQGGARQGIRHCDYYYTTAATVDRNSSSSSSSSSSSATTTTTTTTTLCRGTLLVPSHRSRTSIHWLRGFCFTGGGSFPESPRGTWSSLGCPSRSDLFVRGRILEVLCLIVQTVV